MAPIKKRSLKQPWKRLTLKQKWNILELRKSLEHKSELEKEWLLSQNSNSKSKPRDPKYADIPVLDWFKSASNKGYPISGPSIKAKALEFAKQFHVDNFTRSIAASSASSLFPNKLRRQCRNFKLASFSSSFISVTKHKNWASILLKYSYNRKWTSYSFHLIKQTELLFV